MMKLFNEEITDLKTGLSKYKLLALLFLSQEIIFPQIPFKGFGKITSFDFDPAFNRLVSINYDNNEYSDLLIFNPLNTEAKIYNGVSGTDFKFDKEIQLPAAISELNPIINRNNMIEEYVYTSRKNRQFGILKFSKNGQPVLLHNIQFDYYPENVSVAYNYLTNNNEFLLSGSSFNGISIVSFLQGKLFERKITDKTLFKSAHFIDLNSDGNEDFVTINAVENKLHFFYRNSKSDFEDLRSLTFNSEINALQTFDFNYDGFKDIILSAGKSIFIYFGDATSGYKKSVIVETLFPPDKFVIGDYNRDGFFDIVYTNKSNGIIATIFAKNFESFHTDLVHLKEKGINDLIPFYSKFVYGCAFLNLDGKVSIISKVNSLSEEQQIAIGIKPNLLVAFDFLENSIVDFAFTNDENNFLNFILRDASGFPETFYSIKLIGVHDELKVCDISPTVKCFYFFTQHNREVESLEVDLKNYTFKRRFFYSEGNIEDVVIKLGYKNEPQLNILFSKNGILGLQFLGKNEEKSINKIYNNLEKNWKDPFLIYDSDTKISYIQKNRGNLIVKQLSVIDKKYKTIVSASVDDDNFFALGKFEHNTKLKSHKYSGILFNRNKLYAFVDENLYKKAVNEDDTRLRITEKNQLFFNQNNTVFVSENQNNSFYEIRLNSETKSYRMKKLFDDTSIKNFIVERLEPRSNNLIFTNSKNSTLEIRHLPK